MDEQADVSAAGQEGSPLVLGTEAMRYQWSNQIVSIYSAAGEDRNFVLYPLPRVEGGQSANYLKPSMFFSITDQCQNVDEAAMFIDYFTNNIEANDVLSGERGVPVAAHVRDHLASVVDPVNAKIFEFIANVGEDASPVPPPEPAGYANLIANVFSPEFIDPVLFGMISPEEGWQTFVTDGDAILMENNGS
jgi:multiple sugar transport system substrate-binding protein